MWKCFVVSGMGFLLALPGYQAMADSGVDLDGDGAVSSPGGGSFDCDDADPAVFPGAVELCDGKDNNCDGHVDEGLEPFYTYPDLDRDGYGDMKKPSCETRPGYTTVRGDCNDGDPRIYPGATDRPQDGIDQDCGGTQDPDPQVGFAGSLYASIQEALDAAPTGVIVWVAPGLYLEHDLQFHGKALSLMSTHQAEATTIDAEQQGRVFIFVSGERQDTVLDGFTVTGGRVVGENGAGVFIDASSPTFRNCIMSGNTARSEGWSRAAPLDEEAHGAGLFLRHSDAVFTNCVFSDNWGEAEVVDSCVPGIPGACLERRVESYGGGMYLEHSSPRLTNCRFLNNGVNGLGGHGGALAMNQSSPDLSSCFFENNVSAGIWSKGGAISMAFSDPVLDNCSFYRNEAQFGGGIRMVRSSPKIVDCTFYDNTADDGGGMELSASSPLIDGCVFLENYGVNGGGIFMEKGSGPTIVYSDFLSNTSYNGGGVYIHESEPSIVHSMFTGNRAFDGGGAIVGASATPLLKFCTLVDNEAEYDGGAIDLFGSGLVLQNCSITGNIGFSGGGLSVGWESTALINHSVILMNSAFPGYGAGVHVNRDSLAVLRNTIVAYNDGANVATEPYYPGKFDIRYSAVYSPDGDLSTVLPSLDETVVTDEPGFVETSASKTPTDLHLATDSPLIDAGAPASADVDGSRADIGIYGGPQGDGWDRDRDGYPDYFWPGYLEDAPAGFDPAAYDCNDLDPERQSCG